MESIKSESEHKEKGYSYNVNFFVHPSTEGAPNFEHDEDFSEGTLLECRHAAITYYLGHLQKMKERGQFYDLPFEGYNESFEKGENASYSLTLYLVERDLGKEVKYPIAGETRKRTEEARQKELSVFSALNETIDYNEI